MEQHPFFVGDIWRGHLSNCERKTFLGQNPTPHVIDMTVQSVHTDGVLDVLFTEQTSKTQYLMTGTYDPATLELDLTFNGNFLHQDKSGWVPCDAKGTVSKDMTTLTGDALCDKGGIKQKCEYAGGGEFVLKHDRTKYKVAGAGDVTVNGVYTSVPSNHDLFYSETFQGVPIYRQVSCDETSKPAPPMAGCKMDNVLAQTRIGNQKYWVLTDLESLKSHFESKDDILRFEEQDSEPASLFDFIKYSAWSEEVTPPTYAWRLRGHYGSTSPAPMVEAVVSSMHELQAMAHPLAPKYNAHKFAEKLDGGDKGGLLGCVGVAFLLFLLCVCRGKGGKKNNSQYKGMGGGGYKVHNKV